MSTQLLLEGDDLEMLLTRVRAEYGPDAVLVRAERVRTGGIGGFFARERFELTIEVPDRGPLGSWARKTRGSLGPSARGGAVTGRVAGIDALLAAADAAELARETPSAIEPETSAPEPSAPIPVVAVPVTAVPGEPRLSTGGPTFASVLDSMRSMAGAVPMEGVVWPPTPGPAAVTELLDDTVDLDARPGWVAAGFEPISAPIVVAGSSSLVLRPLGSGRAALLELGVPPALVTHGGPGPVPLSALLRALPTHPQPLRTPGAVVAVVGDGVAVMTTARQMATRLGLTEGDVVLAGDVDAVPGHGRRLQTVVAARRYRDRENADDEVTVVAVGVGPERADQLRAADLLEALRPDQAWAVVDARSKHRDCERWLATVGGARGFDALAVTGIFATAEPGTVLDLGVPVGWIDGLPATRVTWAAVLSGHLGEDARWD
jgi:hypothetical protein